MLNAQNRRDIKGESGRMATALMKYLRTELINRSVSRTSELLGDAGIQFDTIPLTTIEQVRRAYIEILDDPASLDAIKRQVLEA